MQHPMYTQLSPGTREYVAYAAMIDEKVSKGEMSGAEANYLVTAKFNEVHSQSEALAAQNAQIAAANMAIANQNITNGLALMQAGQPHQVYTPSTFTTTTCQPVGNMTHMVSCSSY
jgi:hypothetical protein